MDPNDPYLMRSNPEELGTMILDSEAWVAFRQEKKQLHLHMSSEDAVLLIGDFFVAHPEIRRIVMDYVRDKTKHK
ncbi:hypothetical protein JAO73_10375 [Hymenobacter sp. BT523]|uniref:hypothetical protein n=1 Tax=Hymenobacter sp. BT523 TaxID=2795725 RepID=UPI0018EBC70D|nr:hypothetical protein [Hymenobacter sp. BT523]MBJ6109420.1 hypothetical protein [Hymenobacter sp. BT523]